MRTMPRHVPRRATRRCLRDSPSERHWPAKAVPGSPDLGPGRERVTRPESWSRTRRPRLPQARRRLLGAMPAAVSVRGSTTAQDVSFAWRNRPSFLSLERNRFQRAAIAAIPLSSGSGCIPDDGIERLRQLYSKSLNTPSSASR